MTLLPVFESAQQLEAAGIGVKIVSVINPRRLYRPSDVIVKLARKLIIISLMMLVLTVSLPVML